MKPVQKLSKELPFIKEIEELKQEIDSFKPLSQELKDKVFQKLRLDWNYNTNAIEGNSFTRGETITLLMEGITAKGKPLKDALDIKGHNQAIDFMMQLIKEERNLNESDIRGLHKIVLGEDYSNPAITNEGLATSKRIIPGSYKTAPNHVKTGTGELHYYASVKDTPIKMKELVDWYNETSKLPDVNPIVLASLFHHRFVAIHPFDDGNGRMTRLLTNYILLKFGYPVSVLKTEKRLEYYGALSQADNGEIIPIIEMIAETVQESLTIYKQAINGEDISEPDDIDKRIELFKKESKSFENGFVEKDLIDLSSFITEILSFPSNKLKKLAQTFNYFNEKIHLQRSGFNNHISVHPKMIRKKETYDNLSLSVKKLNKISYSVVFSENVIENSKKKIEVQLEINLRKLNYTISDNFGHKIEKAYSEKIVDDAYINLVLKVVNLVIDELKKE